MDQYRVTDKDGKLVNVGDTIIDFRGDPAVLQMVSRGPRPGKSAKVVVHCDRIDREVYAGVFNLTVEEV